jgi:hypothetical protein
MGVETFRKEFMPQQAIPGDVWYTDFESKHKLFVKTFKKPATAVKAGEEMKKEGGCSIE